MPKYIDAEDMEDGQICIGGKWVCRSSAWGICFKNGSWIYFSTDDERGYISGIKQLGSEEEVCDYVYGYMKNKIHAQNDGYTQKDMASRYMMNKYGYTKEKAAQTAEMIMKHEDIFAEMFNNMRLNQFRGNLINIEGYTAEELVNNDGFTEVAAYRFLVELRENHEEAERLLRNKTIQIRITVEGQHEGRRNKKRVGRRD
ncbi:MAG: hypothetical protein K2I03_09250 [Lachnospiraceae bacterium]|nr:hypothetical protein [Lachnospiraceae bacterium]